MVLQSYVGCDKMLCFETFLKTQSKVVTTEMCSHLRLHESVGETQTENTCDVLGDGCYE